MLYLSILLLDGVYELCNSVLIVLFRIGMGVPTVTTVSTSEQFDNTPLCYLLHLLVSDSSQCSILVNR
jgi:hypothetical protein